MSKCDNYLKHTNVKMIKKAKVIKFTTVSAYI